MVNDLILQSAISWIYEHGSQITLYELKLTVWGRNHLRLRCDATNFIYSPVIQARWAAGSHTIWQRCHRNAIPLWIPRDT